MLVLVLRLDVWDINTVYSLQCVVVGADSQSEACQNFYKDGLILSFTKILTDDAVNGWKYDIQVGQKWSRYYISHLTGHIHTRVTIL